jgi:hypothetical protein
LEWYKDGVYPEWHISGEEFSPKELLHHFPFLILGRTHEKTDIGKLGPLKGKEYGYGRTVIVVDDSIIFKLDWLLDFILENGQKIRELGVKDEILWIIWWGMQGNMELDKSLLSKIAKTGLNMNMNYYYIYGE